MVQLDEKSVALQRLYEKWVTRETWSLAETTFLFLGIEPGEENRGAAYLLLQAELAKAAEEDDLGSLDDAEADNSGYKFEPIEVFTWARKRGIELPLELVNLMEFIIKTTAFSSSDDFSQENEFSSSSGKDAENLLGACVSVLANYPDECRNQKGKVSTERVLKLLDKHSHRLFPDELPGLSSTGIRDLVNNWIFKLRD